MVKRCIIMLGAALLCGCGHGGHMEHPESPDGPFHDQISAARHLLEQHENWADRAEWEVNKSGDGWEVIAWRVEHPREKGPARYLPWGYSVIELDHRSVATEYHSKG